MPQQTAALHPKLPIVQANFFKRIQHVPVSPNEHFPYGGGSEILYIPATDQIAIIVQTKVDHPVTLPTSEVCNDNIIGYALYTTDMQPIDKYGYLTCFKADTHTIVIGNDVYIATMGISTGPGWTLKKFDGVNWNRLASNEIPLDDKEFLTGGPDTAYINGYFVVTSTYRPEGKPIGGTHNHLFTTDLKPVQTILLYPPEVPEHQWEYSLLQMPNDDILLFGCAGPSKGNLEVLRFDKDWHFLEQKWLRDHAYYPNGTATDGRYVYVAYLDWTQPDILPGQNVRLAAFDTQWNLVDDVALTEVQNLPGNLSYGEGTKIVLLGNRIYVSYNIVTLDSKTGLPDHSYSYVDELEISPTP